MRRREEGEEGRREEKGGRRREEGESLEYTHLLLCLPLVESDSEGEERCEHRIQVTPIQQVTKKPATDQKWYVQLQPDIVLKLCYPIPFNHIPQMLV